MKTKVFLILFVVFGLNSVAQTKNFIDKAYLETTAEVDTLVTPDRVYMSMFVSEKDAKTPISELEIKMVDAFKRIGIDTDKQFKVDDMFSSYKRYFFKIKQIKKYKSYSLLVYDAKTAWNVMYELQKLGISMVSISKLEYSKKDKLQLQLKQKAVDKAVLNAKSMLAPLNQKLGKAIYITDIFKDYSKEFLDGPLTIRGSVSGKSSSIKYTPDFDFKKIKFSSKVLVKFEIQ